MFSVMHHSSGPTLSHINLPGQDNRGRRHDDCQRHERMEQRGTHLDEFNEMDLMPLTAWHDRRAQIMIKSSDLGGLVVGKTYL